MYSHIIKLCLSVGPYINLNNASWLSVLGDNWLVQMNNLGRSLLFLTWQAGALIRLLHATFKKKKICGYMRVAIFDSWIYRTCSAPCLLSSDCLSLILLVSIKSKTKLKTVDPFKVGWRFLWEGPPPRPPWTPRCSFLLDSHHNTQHTMGIGDYVTVSPVMVLRSSNQSLGSSIVMIGGVILRLPLLP